MDAMTHIIGGAKLTDLLALSEDVAKTHHKQKQ